MQALVAIVHLIALVFASPQANQAPRKAPIGWASVQTQAQRRYLRAG